MVKLYLYICIILTNIFIIHGLRSKMVRVDRFDICYTPKDAPYILHYFNVKHLPDMNYSLSTSAEVLEEMHAEDLEGDLRVIKCRSREQLDTCETFPTFKTPTNICDAMLIKELGVRATLDKFTPPIRCPIQKTNYSVTDLTYNIDWFTLFPLGNNYWKVRANGYFKKRLVGSVCGEGQSFDYTRE